MIEGPALWALGTAIFTGGMAWGSVKVALNGTKKKVDMLDVKVDKNNTRLTTVETKLDLIHEIVKHG